MLYGIVPEKEIITMGATDYMSGKTLSENRFEINTLEAMLWVQGWKSEYDYWEGKGQ
jgi:hypothetical protein